MRLRAAVRGDASSLTALSIEVWLHTYIRNGVNAHFADYVLDAYTVDTMARAIQDNTVIICEKGDGLIGYIRLAPNAAPVNGASDMEIVTLYVQPRHQGCGAGHALLQAGLDHCRRMDVDAPWLSVNTENTPAVAFYANQGWRSIGKTNFVINDEAYENDVLSITLSEVSHVSDGR